MSARAARSEATRRVGVGVVLLAGVALLAVGALVAVLVLPSRTPAFAEQGTAPTSAAVTTQSFDDERTVTVTLEQEPGRQVVAPAAGRVTASTCTAGGTVSSGDAPFSVDGVPVVALATSVPLWRDLAQGDSGEDVRALQTELVRLGHVVPVDGRYRAATHRAVRALLAERGVALKAADPLPRALLLWLPAEQVAVASCLAPVGTAVDEDDPLIGLPARLVRLTVDTVPVDALPGGRVLDIGGVLAPTDDAGVVTDEAVLAEVVASAAFRAVVAAEEESFDTGWSLATPVELVGVPPRALFGLTSGAGCLSADGAVLPVTVVTSSLGVALVDLGGAAVPERVDLDVDGACP